MNHDNSRLSYRKTVLLIFSILMILVFGGWWLKQFIWWNFIYDKPAPGYSRVRSDMRSLVMAIESYMVDYKRYPPHTFDGDYKTVWPQFDGAPTFDLRASLTTPMALIERYPLDRFSKDETGQVAGFAYFSNGRGWLLVSRGPDAEFNTPFHRFGPDAVMTLTDEDGTSVTLRGAAACAAMLLPYDPTNGTLSSGDIYCFGGYFHVVD